MVYRRIENRYCCYDGREGEKTDKTGSSRADRGPIGGADPLPHTHPHQIFRTLNFNIFAKTNLQNHFKLFIRGPDGFNLWKQIEVEKSCDTAALSCTDHFTTNQIARWVIRDGDTRWWYERVIREGDRRGWYERVIWEGDRRGWYERVIREGDRRGLYERVVRAGDTREWYERVIWERDTRGWYQRVIVANLTTGG